MNIPAVYLPAMPNMTGGMEERIQQGRMDIHVDVSGRIDADGDKLVTVINGVTKRKYNS
jgi:hypothetical protein